MLWKYLGLFIYPQKPSAGLSNLVSLSLSILLAVVSSGLMHHPDRLSLTCFSRESMPLILILFQGGDLGESASRQGK
jgi:hypothetical protein